MGLDVVKKFVVLSTDTGKTEVIGIMQQSGNLYVKFLESQQNDQNDLSIMTQREFDGLIQTLNNPHKNVTL